MIIMFVEHLDHSIGLVEATISVVVRDHQVETQNSALIETAGIDCSFTMHFGPC